MRYIEFPDWLVGMTPKAGWTSMQQAGKGYPTLDINAAARSDKPIVLFVRHPVDRLVSAWRFFHQKAHFPNRHIASKTGLEKFVDQVLKGVEDQHWMSQVKLHTHHRFIPTVVHRFENIHEVWPELPHLNKGPGVPFDLWHRKDEVEEYYRADLELWENAE